MTSVWIVPIYIATKPIDMRTIPIRNVFITTTIASDVKYFGSKKNLIRNIHTSKALLKRDMANPKYIVILSGKSEKEVMLFTASCHNFPYEYPAVPSSLASA